ncbi:unnamed protein product [Rotaria magnacalcarata]|nr:unnamed protein product [Rotaria magnacalcarata]
MSKHSRLIIDISSVTQIIFQNNIFDQNDLSTSIDFIISRTDTILFEPYSFSSLNINSNQVVSFHFELISHIHLKQYSFTSLQLHSSSSFRFYTLFLTRLTMDSYAFQNMSLDTNSVFNFTIQTLATCLCFQSHTFEHTHQIHESRNIRILFTLNNLRGLSFFTNAFSNLSLNHTENQLTILSDNPINDPNPIINFEKESFPSINSGLILLNFSSTTVVKFEQNSLQNNYLTYKIYLKDITLVDLSLLNFNLLKTKMNIHFDYVFYVKTNYKI